MNALKSDNEAYRDKLEAQLSERYEQRRERLLLSSVQTLEAMDRAIDAARKTDAAESFISGVMLVRTQLFRILQEEGLERVSVLGLPFDRRSSEAVERRPVNDPDQDGVVVEELQGGHQLRGHIIRRAKVVVGEYAEDLSVPAPIEPTVAMPVLPAEVTVAMEVAEIEESAEEPIVVEDWTDPTHAGASSTPIDAPAAKLSDRPPAAPAPAMAPDDEDDGSASATMVLGDSAALFVRPAPPPVPVARGTAAPAPAQAAEWESVEQRPGKDPKETQPVPRDARATPPPPLPPTPPAARRTGAPVAARPPERPAPTAPPPRVRTGPVPPVPAPARSYYEDVPTSPNEPAAARPATWTGPPVTPPQPTPSGRGGLYAGLGLVVLLLIAGAAVAVWRMRQPVKPPEPQAAEASPVAAAPPATIPEDVTVVTPGQATTPAPVPSVLAGDAAGAASPPAAVAAPEVAPPTVSTPPPRVAPPPMAATPPPVTAPVNPVPGLLSQAERAMAAKRFDDAISRFNEVLKIDPQNAEASSGKLRALGDRASVGRYFMTAVTMSEGKASGGGIPGFDGGSVVKSQCECALMYEVTPANPVQGEPYAVTVFMRNDSKKDIKPQSLAVSVTVNGSSSNRPVSLAAKQVPRGQRVMVGRLEDIWKVGTTSWSLEAAVGAGGNTYRAQLTWELRVPSGQ